MRDPDPAAGGGGGAPAAPAEGAPGTSTTVQVPSTNMTPPPAYEPPKLDMATALPPEYRDKPHFKGKDFVSLVKEHDNLQKLIGQRPAGIPGETATPEEWDKFLGAMKPKDVTAYQFPETEFSKANKRSPEFEKTAREIFLNAGVHPKMAGKVIEGFETLLGSTKAQNEAKAKEANVARETEFNTLLDKTYGEQRGQVQARVKALIVEGVPADQKEVASKALSNLTNEQLFAMTLVLDGIHKKYIAEDNPPGGGNNAGGDPASLQKEAEETMRSDAYKDFRNSGHDAAKQKVRDLFTRIAGMRTK
jgi:hypothetical protein